MPFDPSQPYETTAVADAPPEAPPFDPTKAYEPDASAFDPSKPFEPVEPSTSLTAGETLRAAGTGIAEAAGKALPFVKIGANMAGRAAETVAGSLPGIGPLVQAKEIAQDPLVQNITDQTVRPIVEAAPYVPGAALRAGGAVAGAIAGSPGGTTGMGIGAGVGYGAGDSLAQQYEKWAGLRQDYSNTENLKGALMVGAGFGLPGAEPALAPVENLIRQGAAAATVGGTAEKAGQVLTGQNDPNLVRNAGLFTAGIGLLGGLIQNAQSAPMRELVVQHAQSLGYKGDSFAGVRDWWAQRQADIKLAGMPRVNPEAAPAEPINPNLEPWSPTAPPEAGKLRKAGTEARPQPTGPEPTLPGAKPAAAYTPVDSGPRSEVVSNGKGQETPAEVEILKQQLVSVNEYRATLGLPPIAMPALTPATPAGQLPTPQGTSPTVNASLESRGSPAPGVTGDAGTVVSPSEAVKPTAEPTTPAIHAVYTYSGKKQVIPIDQAPAPNQVTAEQYAELRDLRRTKGPAAYRQAWDKTLRANKRLAAAVARNATSREATSATKGKSLQFAPRKDGVVDIIEAIQELGGVPKPGNSTSGQFDGWKEAFSGPARVLVSKRTGGWDGFMQDLVSTYPQFAHLEGAYAAQVGEEVNRALASRRQLDQQVNARKATDIFMKAALTGKGRAPKEPRPGEPTPTDELVTGDAFKVKGQDFVVQDVDEAGNVIAQDGPRFGTQVLPAGSELHADVGTVQKVPRENPMDWPTPEPVMANAPAKGELFNTADTFNLASETQAAPNAPTAAAKTDELFSPGETISTPPTKLDQANAAAREAPPGPIEEHSMGRGSPRARKAAPAQPGEAGPLAPAPREPNAFVQELRKAQAVTAPHTLGPGGQWAAGTLREFNARKALEMTRAEHALRSIRRHFERTPVLASWVYDANQPLPHNYAFVDAYETGTISKLPTNEQAAARELHRQNEDWLTRLHAIDPEALKAAIANYFGRVWAQPEAARQVMGRLLAARPLEGSKAFLKQRTHQLFIDGLAAGLRPVSDNPIDLWLLKKGEIENFIMGRGWFRQAQEAGYLKFKYYAEPLEPGRAIVSDPAFVQWGPPTVTIKEAFDAGMRAKTYEVLQQLGVPHERLVKLGGQRWGYARKSPTPAGPGEIASKFGGPEDVVWHELGHVLDFRYPDLRTRMFGGEPSVVASARAARNFKRKVKPEQERILALDDELRALADARGGQGKEVSESYRKYLRKTAEKMAVVLQAYLHAPDLMQRIAPGVKAEFESFLNAHPELQIIKGIRPSLELGTAEAQMPVGGLVKLGDWTLPADAAQVVGNFLSSSLNRHLWYRSLRGISNTLNAAQLGFSGFHLGFTTLDVFASHLEMAINAAAKGELLSAARIAASAPASPITNFRAGLATRRAALNPASLNAEIVKQLEQAGVRVTADRFWLTNYEQRMRRAFHMMKTQIANGEWLGGASEGLKAAVNAAFVPLEKQMGFIHWVVNTQKLGLFMRMAAQDLARLGPNATDEQMRLVLGRNWNSVENRMGQVTYDNYFYNRTLKDVALLSFRAFGWQQGKFLELGGAVADTTSALKQLASGVRKTMPGTEGRVKQPLFTRRMGYAMALPLAVGIVGSILYYIFNGKRPEQARDLFQPRTGEKDAHGNDVRMNLPGYMKDLFAYQHHPVTAFAHSLNPAISAAFDLLQNADFYNVQIYNPDDPLWQQGSDIAKWALGESVPFSVSGAQNMREQGAPAWKQVAPFFGVTPVPVRQNMTPAQELAAEIMAGSLPQAAMTTAQADKNKLARDIVRAMREGRRSDAQALRKQGIDAGTLNPAQSILLMERGRFTPLQWQMRQFTPEAALRVWRVANDAERASLVGLIRMKIANSQTTSPKTKHEQMMEINEWRPVGK